jgi:hypothetical protein
VVYPAPLTEWLARDAWLSGDAWLPDVPANATSPGRWVDSCDLRVGDEVLLRDGRIVPLDAVAFRPFEGYVYNMEVDERRYYTVGRNSVLVYNANGELPGMEGAPPNRTLNDPLPPNPKKPTQANPHAPDPQATGPHTVLGTRTDPTSLIHSIRPTQGASGRRGLFQIEHVRLSEY